MNKRTCRNYTQQSKIASTCCRLFLARTKELVPLLATRKHCQHPARSRRRITTTSSILVHVKPDQPAAQGLTKGAHYLDCGFSITLVNPMPFSHCWRISARSHPSSQPPTVGTEWVRDGLSDWVHGASFASPHFPQTRLTEKKLQEKLAPSITLVGGGDVSGLM